MTQGGLSCGIDLLAMQDTAASLPQQIYNESDRFLNPAMAEVQSPGFPFFYKNTFGL